MHAWARALKDLHSLDKHHLEGRDKRKCLLCEYAKEHHIRREDEVEYGNRFVCVSCLVTFHEACARAFALALSEDSGHAMFIGCVLENGVDFKCPACLLYEGASS